MIRKLATAALGLVCVLAILFLVAFQSKGADFDSDWLLEDLTCEELVSAYSFNIEVLQQVIHSYNECLAYADSPADSGHGRLHCALIKLDGKFIEGLTNDLVNVFNAKLECRDKGV